MRHTVGLAALALLSIAFLGTAHAQYSVPSQASRSGEKLVIATGGEASIVKRDTPLAWELGASLNFITSEESLGGRPLALTDIALLRLHASTTLGRYELFAGADLLPKQPSYTDEHIWQGSLAGVKAAVNRNISVWGRGQLGPLLDKNGTWFAADAAVQYHYELQDILFFESAIGASHTQLQPKGTVGSSYFLDEVFTTVGLALRDKRGGKFGMWLNFDYYIPVFHRPTVDNPDPETLGALDPQPRVNIHMGALGAVTKSVSLFIDYAILDRGDLEAPLTTMPFLNTGFDQRQVIVGFIRHFGGARSW